MENLLANPTFWGITISATIAICSWFIIAYLNRKNENYKLRLLERFRMRQKMFDLYIDFSLFLNDAIMVNNGHLDLNNFNLGIQRLGIARPYFQIYGYESERQAIEKFIDVIETEYDTAEERLEAFQNTLEHLNRTVLTSIRKEYGYQQPLS